MDRAAAWELLCEYTKNENLRKHALAVEACVKPTHTSSAKMKKNGA